MHLHGNMLSWQHIHTYIHKYESELLTKFLTPLMLRVLILYINGGTYCLKSTPDDKFFEKLFMTILFTLRVFATNLLRGNRR